MKQAIFRFLYVFSILAALGALLFFSYQGLRNADSALPALFPPSQAKRVVITMEGFRLVETEKGKVAWTVQARRADLLEKIGRAHV